MKAHRKHPFRPDFAVPPGATLEETMETLGMSQRELANRTGLTVQTLNRIFRGEQPISYETANKLELVTGTPAAFWNNLEAQYREQLAKRAQAEEMERHVDWLKAIPVRELLARQAIPASAEKVEILRTVLRFYAVSSVDAWHAIWDQPAAASRRPAFHRSRLGPTSAWLRLGQIEARTIDCAPFRKSIFLKNLRKIRALTARPPSRALPEVRRLCATSGVALALIPEIKGAPWSSAAEWLTPAKAMILLNLRGKSPNKIWFSFFHQASHILHDSKKETFIDDGQPAPNHSKENQANEFAFAPF